jgi:DNA-directed RNA polymerase specialized sigma24 family protein
MMPADNERTALVLSALEPARDVARRLARVCGLQPADRDDLLGAALVAVLEAARDYDPRLSPWLAWACLRVRGACLRALFAAPERFHRRRVRGLRWDVADPRPGPAKLAQRRLDAAHFLSRCHALGRLGQDLVASHVYGGQARGEVAARNGVSRRTADRRLARALEVLRPAGVPAPPAARERGRRNALAVAARARELGVNVDTVYRRRRLAR